VSTTDRVDRISIIPSGMAGGFTAYKPDEDKNYDTKSHLLENIIVALGGRAAEQLVLGEISTGAYQDLKKANGIARSMITKYGMSENLGNLVFGNESDEVFIGRDFAQARNYSEEIAAQIDREVKHIIDSCYDRIMKILKENINKLHAVANTLIEKEKIDGHEFEELISSTT
jgi:cell division protease FtsH